MSRASLRNLAIAPIFIADRRGRRARLGSPPRLAKCIYYYYYYYYYYCYCYCYNNRNQSHANDDNNNKYHHHIVYVMWRARFGWPLAAASRRARSAMMLRVQCRHCIRKTLKRNTGSLIMPYTWGVQSYIML